MNTGVVLCFSVVFLWSFGVIWSTITSSEENQLSLACTTLTWANQLQSWYSVIFWFCNDIIFWKHRRPGLTLIHPIRDMVLSCRWTGYGFYLSILNRVYNLVWVCPKQGMQARIHTGFHRFTEIGHIFPSWNPVWMTQKPWKGDFKVSKSKKPRAIMALEKTSWGSPP